MQPDTIINANCLDNIHRLPAGIFDLCIMDPPYEVDYASKINNLRDMDKDSKKHINIGQVDGMHPNIPWGVFLCQLYSVMKQDSTLLIFSSQKLACKIYNIVENQDKFTFRQFLIWKKSHATFDMTFGLKYAYTTEIIIYLQKGSRKINQRTNRIDIIEIDKTNKSGFVHPTQKPIELIKFLMKDHSNPGDLIFDPFMGSGTTALAAKQSDRHFFGYEIDAKFHKVAMQRMCQEVLATTQGGLMQYAIQT